MKLSLKHVPIIVIVLQLYIDLQQIGKSYVCSGHTRNERF